MSDEAFRQFSAEQREATRQKVGQYNRNLERLVESDSSKSSRFDCALTGSNARVLTAGEVLLMKLRRSLVTALIGAFAVLASDAVGAPITPDPLAVGFETPPSSARPRVWWHWMNGNITKEGIRLDLEWMQRAGLGGFQNFDAAVQTPQVVPRRLAYMTPEWQDAFKYAVTLADRMGLETAIASAPGWSESGGPWVPPAEGMKKYVWSATEVHGGRPFTGQLPLPPVNTGAFQDLPVHDLMPLPTGAAAIPQFYADSVVIAYPKPAGDVDLQALQSTMSSSGGTPDFKLLTDGHLTQTTPLPIPKIVGQSVWIQYAFAKPQTVRALTVAMRDPTATQALVDGVGAPERSLQASDDGQHFREVAHLVLSADSFNYPVPEYTLSFAPVRARYFRVVFKRNPLPPLPNWAIGFDLSTLGTQILPLAQNYEISELVLHSAARVSHWVEKAAFVPASDLYSMATSPVPPEQTVAKSQVLDLTSRMRPDGHLDWTPPHGDWIVLRFGYSLLGMTNHPATAEATGLEVDKLDHRFVKHYFETYLDSYRKTVGPELMGAKGIQYVVNDSWEARSQNWTDNMIGEFKKRRGYSMLPWMPVLTGHIVEGAEASDRFLWDFRKTIAELIAEEHYGQIEATLHEHHLGHYGESHEMGRALVADGMEVKKLNEIPMSAMWAQRPGVNNELYDCNADDRESASVAHIYGQNLAAAESLTASAAPWAWSPATLKPTADQEFLNGINRIVIHESAHQPLIDKAPGLTLGPFGQWFNRNETWAKYARPWIDYLARTSFLLQQGRFGADIVYFYGEDTNLTALFATRSPPIPAGYGFDYINADALIHDLSSADGALIARSGVRYRLLGLDPNSQQMSLPVLRAIHRLVENGAVVAGPKPTNDPSLADDPKEFEHLSTELFGDGTGIHSVGQGTIYAGVSLGDALNAIRVSPDFDHGPVEPDANLQFVHRKLPDGDLYFVDNRSDRATSVNASFRVTGKVPELWRAEDASRERVSFTMTPGRTTIPLKLEPWGAVFVVFRQSTGDTSYTEPARIERPLATLDGEWKIDFQRGRGAPASITVDRLESWTQHTDNGVKYFSGIATYTKTIYAKAAWVGKNAEVWIDLGDVKNLAEVSLNGQSLGVLWHAPYRINISRAIKPGANELSIKVINAWVNRMIGDQQPGVATPITFTDVKPYNAHSPLLVSGLLGPVRVLRLERE